MGIGSLVASSGYFIFNKKLAKTLGIECAVLIGIFASWQDYNNGQPFSRDRDKLIEESCLTEYSFKKALKELKDKGIIQVELKDVPARAYYCIDEQKLEELLKFRQTSWVDFDPTRKVDFEQTNNTINKSTNKEINRSSNIYKEKEIQEKESFDQQGTEFVSSKQAKLENMFEEFWKLYPKKVAKKAAFAAFKNVKNLNKVFELILDDIRRKKQSQDWLKNNGQYIPHPTTYLHQERWLDEKSEEDDIVDKFVNSENPFYSEETKQMLKEMGL